MWQSRIVPSLLWKIYWSLFFCSHRAVDSMHIMLFWMCLSILQSCYNSAQVPTLICIIVWCGQVFLFTVRKRPSRTVDKWLSRYRRLLWTVKRLEKKWLPFAPKEISPKSVLRNTMPGRIPNTQPTYNLPHKISSYHKWISYCKNILLTDIGKYPVHTQSESNIFTGFGSRKRSTVVAMKWIIALLYIQHEN